MNECFIPVAEMVCFVLWAKKCHQPHEISVIWAMQMVVQSEFTGGRMAGSFMRTPLVLIPPLPVLGLSWAEPSSSPQESESSGWVRKGKKCEAIWRREITWLVIPWDLSAAPSSAHHRLANLFPFLWQWDRACLWCLNPGQNTCKPIWCFPKQVLSYTAPSEPPPNVYTQPIEKEIAARNNSLRIWSGHYLRTGGLFSDCYLTFTI